LPLTASGKVDRRALPAVAGSRQASNLAYVAPHSPLEVALASAWAEVLGAEKIGVHDNFFEVGGHSLLAARLAARLAESTGVEVPLRSLFEAPTVAGVARLLSEHHPATVVERFGAESLFTANQAPARVADLEADVELDFAIAGATPSDKSVTDPDRVFLTGATGFLGAFLLHDLLEHTRAPVYCLVRASDERAARGRIEKSLHGYGLWRDNYADRIVAVVGDLAAPRLGLSLERFSRLADEVDVIYHNGAVVNFLQPYEAHRPANVGGTREVLRLAALRKLKPVHYVSTIGVFGDRPEVAPPRETDAARREGLAGGYNQSKWVAERLVALAGQRGLPVTVYRPGRIAWHSVTGVANSDDLLTGAIRLCIQTGKCPRTDGPVFEDITPVDYVTSAILYLSRRNSSLGKVFHLLNPGPVDLRLLLDGLRMFGYTIQDIPEEQWRQELAVSALDPVHGLAAALLTALLGGGSHVADSAATRMAVAAPMVDYRDTGAELAAAGISCPEVTAEIIRRFLAHGQRAGLFPAPQQPAEKLTSVRGHDADVSVPQCGSRPPAERNPTHPVNRKRAGQRKDSLAGGPR
jgi:thioester reductase-like protein